MSGLLFMRTPGLWEVLIILFIVLLLFGGRKIPELMKGLGKGIRNFKEGINNPDEEEKENKAKE